MARALPFEPTHGDRVRIGFDGPKGVVIKCRTKDGSGTYFKVKLDDGTWVWPDGAVADSAGAYDLKCRDCSMQFRSDYAREVLCPNCARRGDRQDPGTRSSSWQRRQYRRRA